jgi:hypothetical protein
MKFKCITFLAILVFASAGAISIAQAQSDELEKANVPFDFYAGGQKMPAGNYTIAVDLETKMITLSNDSGEHKIFLIGIPTGDGGAHTELIFEHSGNTYALNEVESEDIDLMFQTKVPALALESRMDMPEVKVAMNR